MFTLNPDKIETNRARRARFVLKPGFLDQEREKATHYIPADNPEATGEHIKDGVRKGELKVLDIVTPEGREIGFAVYRIIERDGMRECLVVSLQAKNGERMLPALESAAVEFAAGNGCNSMRMHSMRIGLVRPLIDAGWFVSEIVMRKTLNPGNQSC